MSQLILMRRAANRVQSERTLMLMDAVRMAQASIDGGDEGHRQMEKYRRQLQRQTNV